MKGQLVTFEQSADPDYEEYIKNQEMYWVSKFLLDLKYLGTIHKSLPETFGIFIMSCNPYWLHFFIELRTFLGWPIAGQFFDFIGQSLQQPCINEQQHFFLSNLHKSL
ncbi:MAG: hypothetical protein IPP48_06085 [Chitinophagaceae bacterium]|nr:hypothetical protein [Chitinophagaceae bacterium]